MEETTNLWNKTAAELTVKDQLVVMVIAPVIVVGGMIVAGAVVTVAEKIGKKLRRSKPDPKIVTDEEN